MHGGSALFAFLSSLPSWASVRGFGQSLFKAPPAMKSLHDKVVVCVACAGGLLQRHLLSIKLYTNIRSTVVLLFVHCRPAAIAWRVRTVGVDSIQRMQRGWARPHVSIKGLETVAPPVAHDDPAPAIGLVAIIVWVVAAVFCTSPNAVLGRAVALCRHAVRGVSLPQSLGRQASATARSAGRQTRSAHDALRAALASTSPLFLRADGGRMLRYDC